MSIELMREINNTGNSGDFWRLNGLHIERGVVGTQDILTGRFDQYTSFTDYGNAKNKTGLSVTARIVGNITLATDIQQLFDAVYGKITESGAELEGGAEV
jgi:hypothetical protein